jgi:hypothetical protein
MSVRHFNYRRRRHGISQRARITLGAALGGTILLQMIYPLVSGDTLRIITIATIYTGATAMVLHAYLSFGRKYASRYLLFTALFGYFIELLVV